MSAVVSNHARFGVVVLLSFMDGRNEKIKTYHAISAYLKWEIKSCGHLPVVHVITLRHSETSRRHAMETNNINREILTSCFYEIKLFF